MGNSDNYKILTYEEEMKLSKQEFMDYEQRAQAYFRSKRTEIARGYAEKTHEEKTNYRTELGRQMRWQAESGLDPYAAYTAEWRENLLRFEPDLDNLIREAFVRSLN
ncbi:hypothetical protein IC229_28025 [Spirosoma sp. BT702]|uniref:Uncharacterized protein n=1 Tax=Spirosoma profusum TaxID=2771354 RepID=A0A926Y1S6_9BACT|nr:hypothetical protein [Spirosoma profusum]MBD2704521.1 hypothetical protein [Spirosoma profusum]